MARRKSNGEGSIYTETRNGRTYYKATITVGWDSNGKQIRKSFGSFKKSQIVSKMNEARYEIKKNIFVDTDLVFKDLFESWVKDYKSKEVNNNTFFKYETTYRLRVLPYFISRKKIKDIKIKDVQDYFNELEEKYTAATIRTTYTHINSCFKFAIARELIIKNPCVGVILPKIKKNKNKITFFTMEEQNQIIQKLDLNNIVDIALFLDFYTGLRLGELLGLTWDNFDGKNLKITQQYARKTYIDEYGRKRLTHELRELKTENSERIIPLTDKCLELLKRIERIKMGTLIFCDSNGKGLDHKRLQRRITNLCKELKISHRSFHSIRHSFATRLFELNVPVKTVQELMGHRDITTTMNIYTHVVYSKKEEALSKLNNI